MNFFRFIPSQVSSFSKKKRGIYLMPIRIETRLSDAKICTKNNSTFNKQIEKRKSISIFFACHFFTKF